jgi:hypothetical protein
MQSSLTSRANQELAFRYFGPFSVLQKVGNIAYKLALPYTSIIHPIFHVLQLKKVVGDDIHASASLPSWNLDCLVGSDQVVIVTRF